RSDASADCAPAGPFLVSVPTFTNGRRMARTLLTALLLTGVWYLLSGKFDVLHFGFGVAAAVLIAASLAPVSDGTTFRPLRFAAYVPWLVGQIFISNLRVARIALSPRMPIAP